MTRNQMKKTSNAIFAGATGFALITLVIVGKDYIAMWGQEACPINRHHQLIYLALALLLCSIVITSILDSKVKKLPEVEEEKADIYEKTLETLKREDEPESKKTKE